MDLREIHWLMSLLSHTDVGIAVFDLQGRVRLWNNFMENHSGISASELKNRGSLFDVFPVFHEPWLQNKLQSSLLLDHGAYINWEQYPHLFDFAAYRPLTGDGGRMYQNVSINALKNASGEADLIALVVYDVTSVALNQLALQRANAELEQLSRTDRLTGVANRGHWQECLLGMVELYQRYHTPCSLIMFDIDHFKRINDGFGHQAGDQVIRELAQTAAAAVRNCDIVGRYGGEEFGILLPETGLAGAAHFAERLRRKAEALDLHHHQQSIPFTISLGVAEINATHNSEQAWLEAADQALYRAKQAGRNQVCCAGEGG